MSSIRSLDPAEDYAQLYLRRAAAQVIENTGFSHCRESALNLISDLTRRFMEKLWFDGKLFAEHAGRLEPNLQDAHMVFQKLQLRTAELSDYMRQVASRPINHKVPRFPISKNRNKSIYGSVSERELAERPEYIPSYFPAVHPEWCADHANLVENQIPPKPVVTETSNNEKRRNAKLSVYPAKSKVPFPDFTGMTAKGLGLVRQKRTSMASLNRVPSEPSGISSSANLSSAQLNVSPSTSHSNKLRHKKSSLSAKNIAKQSSVAVPPISKPHVNIPPVTTVPDPIPHVPSPQATSTTVAVASVASSSVDESKALEEKVSEDGSESPAIRPSGMFGMPPSAAVCSDSSFVSGDKLKKKKKKDKSGVIKTKEKKDKHKEKEEDKDKEKEKDKIEFKIHEELASSSAAFMHDDIPLSILSSRVLGENYNAGLSNAGSHTSSLLNDADEKPCPILTPILPRIESPLTNFSREETPSKPPELIQQAAKPKKEFKRSKSEKTRPKVKSVEIIPSDDSDSDASIKLPSSSILTVPLPNLSHSLMKEVDSKQNHDVVKSHSAVNSTLRVNVSEKYCKGRENASERLNKENHNDNAKSSTLTTAPKQPLPSLPKATAKNASTTIETLQINTGDEEASTPLKEGEPPIKVIFSRPVGQSEFSAFSPTEKNSPQWKEPSPVSNAEPPAKVSSDLNIQTPVTIKLDAREESLRKEKKKKHKKDKERDHGEKDEGHHHHHHKKKDKKKDKEHKKEKHSAKDGDDILAMDAQVNRKRKSETDQSELQPELKIPKLKIKIGGSNNSSNNDSIRQSSKICSMSGSTSFSSLSKDVAKVNNKPSSSTSPDRPGQNTVTAEKIHIPIKDTVSEPITKVSNFCSFKDVQSIVKSSKDDREPKRIQCVTKAELKVVPKASKKTELPLFSTKTETRREEVKDKAQKSEEKVTEQGKAEGGRKEERDRRKDREKETEKDKDSSRENGRVHDNSGEKERGKEFEKKDAVRLKEKDRKDRTDREKCKDENRKEGTKQKKDTNYEKDKRRPDDAPVLFDDRSGLRNAEKDNGSNEKWNRAKEPKLSRNVVVAGSVKKKRSVATTSNKSGGNNDGSKNSVLKSSKEQRSVVGDDDDVWICPECSVAYVDGGTDMVCCDGCDNWFHWSCVGLLVAPPENTDWFCQSCIKKKSVKRISIPGKIGNAVKKPKKVL